MVKKLLIAFAAASLAAACTKPGGGNACPSIPPVKSVPAPAPRAGFVWMPAYVDWVNGGWQEVPGHWERQSAAGGSNTRIPGRWDSSQQGCVWIPSRPARDHRT
jgi:hypothetical protein